MTPIHFSEAFQRTDRYPHNMRSFLARHWFLTVLALGIGVALITPDVMTSMMVHWEPHVAVFVSLFLIAWMMPTHALLAELRHPYASMWAMGLSYGLVPGAAWLIGSLAPADVQVGLIVVGCVPCTLSAAVLWTRMAGGNEATALLTVMGTTFTSWFLTTAWLLWLTGAQIQLDVADMAIQLVVTLILPVVLGQALRWIPPCGGFADRHIVLLGVLSQIMILAMILKAGASVGRKLHEQNAWEAPRMLLWSIGLTIALHLFALASGFVSCRWLGIDRGRQIAVAFSASQKTLPVSLMLYEQYYMGEFPYAVMPLLFYHIGQLLLDTVIANRLRHSARDSSFSARQAPRER